MQPCERKTASRTSRAEISKRKSWTLLSLVLAHNRVQLFQETSLVILEPVITCSASEVATLSGVFCCIWFKAFNTATNLLSQ